MGRSKIDKFVDNTLRRNVVEAGKPFFLHTSGNWKKQHFENMNPVTLEIACGKGEYTVGLARLFPDRNFIGIDIKGSRIWRGSLIAENESLKNAAFLRILIQDLDKHFDDNEVETIWITFPDPRPRERDRRKRLTHNRYLEIYKRILNPGGWIHVKTDSDSFFNYSLETIASFSGVQHLVYTNDLYQSGFLGENHGIKTAYEQRFLEQGIKIKYLKFQMNK